MSKARDLADFQGSASALTTGTLPVDRVPYVGRRNLFYNGDMRVAQRGTSFSTSVPQANYTVDRWRYELGSVNIGSTLVYEQSTDAPEGFKYSLKLTNTTGLAQTINVTDYNVITQKLENQDTYQLNWGTPEAKPVTLSFWVKSSVAGSWLETGFRRDASGTTKCNYELVTIDNADTWEYKTITFVGDVSDGINSNAGHFKHFDFFFSLHGVVGGLTTTAHGEWQEGNLLAGPNGATDSFLSQTGATLYITGVQLELGSVATPFEHRSYGEELALCQRYYQKSYAQNNFAGTTTLNGAIYGRNYDNQGRTVNPACCRFPVTMRTAPTATIYSLVGTQGSVSDCGDSASHSANLTFNNFASTLHDGGFSLVSSGSVADSNIFGFHYEMDAEL